MMQSGQSLTDGKLWSSYMGPKHHPRPHTRTRSLGCRSPRYEIVLALRVPDSRPFQITNETYKAAAHLVVTGKKRKYPKIKIILAHLGGSTPMLAARVAGLSPYMGCPLSAEQILEDFRSFYFETALSSYAPTLTAMREFAEPDHILFGTDFPGEYWRPDVALC